MNDILVLYNTFMIILYQICFKFLLKKLIKTYKNL